MATMTTPQNELQARKAMLLRSNWVGAAPDAKQEFNPVSETPLERSYQRNKSATRDMLTMKRDNTPFETERTIVSPASTFVAFKYAPPPKAVAGSLDRSSMNIVLGSDGRSLETTNTSYGSTTGHRHPPPIDLLQQVAPKRDTTLDGSHRASMTEQHFANIWNPFKSDFPTRAASSTSGEVLRDMMHRNTRSQFDPDERYFLPPTEQYVMGWGIKDKYGQSCAKYVEGAAWYGRTGSHITKFMERQALGARHHLSGPMTKTTLHY